jgi:hypothetical protein
MARLEFNFEYKHILVGATPEAHANLKFLESY